MMTSIEIYKNRPTRAEISLPNLRNNFAIVKSLVDKSVKIIPAVKGNGYGHGILKVSEELLKAGADYLCVAYIEEAVYLRKNGIKAPILVLGAINEAQIPNFIENDIEIMSSSIDKSIAISETAQGLGKNANIHLKIDTGMERIGVHWYHADKFIERTYELKNLNIKGICSHLAKADSDPEFNREQLRRFDSVLEFMDKKSIIPEFVHIANSAGIINFKESHYNMVRPGIMLYGYNPNGYLPDVQFGDRKLKPVMNLKTKVSFFKVCPENTGISYNHKYFTKTQTRIITLPIGYADGYNRLLSNKGQVVIRGKKYPVAGTVCMDQVMIDIGMNGTAYNGDDVLLFGEMEGTKIPLESLCEKTGTITYEFLTSISSRVPRIYFD